MPKRQREAVPNATLYNLRDARGMTQQEVAEELNALAKKHQKPVHVDNVTVSRWERGVIERPSPLYRRLLAELFEVSLEELGFTRPATVSALQTHRNHVDIEAFVVSHSPMSVEPRVQADQEQWRVGRRLLNRHRPKLARVASQLYTEDQRFNGTGLLAGPSWLPARPIELQSVDLAYLAEVASPAITGAEPEARGVRPLASAANRYQRYSHALRDIDHPGLFENRLCYRLLDLDLSSDEPRMSFGHTTYFETVDVNEALGHEVACAVAEPDGEQVSTRPPSWRQLPLRRLVGDPFDLAKRPVLASIDTLTIRNDPDQPTFVLHDRSAARVATAGGMLHIMPAGVFQPSSILPGAQVEDFDLWRNIMREYSEEFLGNREHDGDGAPVDYTAEPFGSLDRSIREGGLRVYCLGVGLDALTMYAEVLTVAVFEPDLYDELFADMVETNDEGSVVTMNGADSPTSAIPFDRFTVPRLLDHDALAPAARGCLQLSWDHREALLGR